MWIRIEIEGPDRAMRGEYLNLAHIVRIMPIAADLEIIYFDVAKKRSTERFVTRGDYENRLRQLNFKLLGETS